jgi:hypothetical protein
VPGLDPFRPAVALDVGPAGVDGPDRVADLPPDEFVVVGIAGAEGHVGLTLSQIDDLVAHNELHLQGRMQGTKAI